MTPVDVPREPAVLNKKLAILRQELREAEERAMRLLNAGNKMQAAIAEGEGMDESCRGWIKAKEAKP